MCHAGLSEGEGVIRSFLGPSKLAQNRYKIGTKLAQNRYKTGINPVQNWYKNHTKIGLLICGSRSLGAPLLRPYQFKV